MKCVLEQHSPLKASNIGGRGNAVEFLILILDEPARRPDLDESCLKVGVVDANEVESFQISGLGKPVTVGRIPYGNGAKNQTRSKGRT